MSATAYMEALSNRIGEKVALSDGQAALALDGRGFLLRWDETAQRFMVHVELGPLAGWQDGGVCKLLLAANFLMLETDGGALSYNPASNMVGLNHPVETYGMDPQGFLDVINRILALAEGWRERLARMGQEKEHTVRKARQRFLHGDADPAEAIAEELPLSEMAQSPCILRV